MVDYVSTEIVAYADNIVTYAGNNEPKLFSYDMVYPDPLSFNGSTSEFHIVVGDYVLYYTVDVPFDFVPDNFNWNNLVNSNSTCWKVTFTGFQQIINGVWCNYYSVDYSYSGFYFSKSVDDGNLGTGNLTLYRCPFELTPYSLPTVHDDVYLLSEIGRQVIGLGAALSVFLTTDIGGYSLTTVLFGSAFAIYVAWSLFKWFIPI